MHDDTAAHPEAEALARFLGAEPPVGAATLDLTRFRKHTGTSRVNRALDDLLGDEGEAAPAPAGLRLDWTDEHGRPLRTLTLHPAASGVEDELLPRGVSAAFGCGAVVRVIARHQALGAAEKVVDTLAPIAPGTPPPEGYRAGPPPPPMDALETLTRAGFEVRHSHARQFAASRARRVPRRPLWLLMLVPIALFAPALVLLQRSFRGVLNMLRDVLTRALFARDERLALTVDDGQLTVACTGHPELATHVELPLREVLAVGFGPAGVQVTDEDPGRLRIVTAQTCTTLPHTAAAHAHTSNERSEAAAHARDVGRALRVVLTWLVTSHRTC
ncbi:MAG: hypothetical protein R3B40_07905 [Polyangiales bacterium]